MLLPIQGLFAASDVRAMRAALDEGDWLDGGASAGSQAAAVKRNRQLNAASALAIELGEKIIFALQRHPLFMSAALPNRFYPPMFNRYGEQETYGAHVDSAIMNTGTAAGMLRTDLSATLFLTDPDQYKGGELVVRTTFGDQAIKLAAGDLILYPSTSLHEVAPVTAGERICAVLWIESLVRSGEQRELLFELDQSIQALTVDRGSDDDEVRRLSGVYHNLVRQWAQT